LRFQNREQKNRKEIYRTYFKNTDPKVRKGAKRKKVRRGGEKESHFSAIENCERVRKRKNENTSRQRETLA